MTQHTESWAIAQAGGWKTEQARIFDVRPIARILTKRGGKYARLAVGEMIIEENPKFIHVRALHRIRRKFELPGNYGLPCLGAGIGISGSQSMPSATETCLRLEGLLNCWYIGAFEIHVVSTEPAVIVVALCGFPG